MIQFCIIWHLIDIAQGCIHVCCLLYYIYWCLCVCSAPFALDCVGWWVSYNLPCCTGEVNKRTLRATEELCVCVWEGRKTIHREPRQPLGCIIISQPWGCPLALWHTGHIIALLFHFFAPQASRYLLWSATPKRSECVSYTLGKKYK